MESSPDTLTDIAQECTQNVQRITSEDTEITQVHTIFLLFVSLYRVYKKKGNRTSARYCI